MGRVKQGRLGDGADWSEHWKVYDELVEKHSDLGQDIDFSDLKSSMDCYFLFDNIMTRIEEIRKPILEGRDRARKLIAKEFGSPINDAEGYSRRRNQLKEVPEKLEKPLFEIAQEDDLAARILDWANPVN